MGMDYVPEGYRFETQDIAIVIPELVQTIKYSAYSSMPNLTTVTIPKNVQYVDEWAFAHNTNLKKIYIENALTTFHPQAFAQCNEVTDVIYGGTKDEWTTWLSETIYFDDGVVIHCIDGDIRN